MKWSKLNSPGIARKIVIGIIGCLFISCMMTFSLRNLSFAEAYKWKSRLITPKALGDLNLGDDVAAIEKILGKPDKKSDYASGQCEVGSDNYKNLIYYSWKEFGVLFFKGKAVRMSTTSKDLETQAGFKVGMKIEEKSTTLEVEGCTGDAFFVDTTGRIQFILDNPVTKMVDLKDGTSMEMATGGTIKGFSIDGDYPCDDC
jgi:hypothetical protein